MTTTTLSNPSNRLTFDWITVLLYLFSVTWGILNIFAVVYQPETAYFGLSLNSTKQMMFFGASFIVIIAIVAIDFRFFFNFAYLVYAGAILLLLLVLFLGSKIAGSTSWFRLGMFGFQPSEISKFATALALAKYLSSINIRLDHWQTRLTAGAIIGIPALLILRQGDLGSAMVYSSFIFVLYREGLPDSWFASYFAAIILFVLTLFVAEIYLIITLLSIALIVMLYIRLNIVRQMSRLLITTMIVTLVAILFVMSSDYIVNNVLKGYQRDRIMVLVNPDNAEIVLRAGWNIRQSKIAIGSGGLLGKGFLQGTQTKLNFVPEQSTDFIFCTIGEEYGWLGSLVIVSLFMYLLYRLILIAERQKDHFVRIYGYGVASILFFHFSINIAMTIGLFPVVGIPLPFFSYGGSSLLSFTILLFVFLKLDAYRGQMLSRT